MVVMMASGNASLETTYCMLLQLEIRLSLMRSVAVQQMNHSPSHQMMVYVGKFQRTSTYEFQL